jgi:hypothetical protein
VLLPFFLEGRLLDLQWLRLDRAFRPPGLAATEGEAEASAEGEAAVRAVAVQVAAAQVSAVKAEAGEDEAKRSQSLR